jgi:hypothetical protein
MQGSSEGPSLVSLEGGRRLALPLSSTAQIVRTIIIKQFYGMLLDGCILSV